MTDADWTHYTESEHGYAIYNPHDKPVQELPFIWGFNNGGSQDWWYGQLISQDGMGLGGHLCSSEGFMYGDLGVLSRRRADRHATFREYYPDGYRMDFVPLDEVETHEGLKRAYELNEKLAEEARQEETEDPQP